VGLAVLFLGNEGFVCSCRPLCCASSVPLSPTPPPRGGRGSFCCALCFVSIAPFSPTSLLCFKCSVAPRGSTGSRAMDGPGSIEGLVATTECVAGNELGVEGLVAVFLLTVLRVCCARWAREEGVASLRGATPEGLRSVMRSVKRPRPVRATHTEECRRAGNNRLRSGYRYAAAL
jgi:hypothetical protein